MSDRLRRLLCWLFPSDVCDLDGWCYSPSRCMARAATDAWEKGISHDHHR